MKVTSKKPKGQRMYKSVKFDHGTFKNVKRPLWIEPIGTSWWFVYHLGQWVKDYDFKKPCSSSYYCNEYEGFKSVYSLKAAKRLIANWDLPKGTKVRVSLPFCGYDFIATK